MQEIDEQIIQLLYKRIAGEELEEEEEEMLGSWLAESPHHAALLEELLDEPRLEEEVRALMAIDEDAALKKLQDTMAREKRTNRLPAKGLRYVAAAVIVVLAVAGIYMFTRYRQAGKPERAQAAYNNDVAPGSSHALLTLADGSTLVLDSTTDGILKNQAGALIHKDKSSVAYETLGTGFANGSAIPFNTISTPQKGEYQVVLPDGSRVWLNAASRLRFPIVFNGTERKVSLEGEAYFEVERRVKDGAALPFKVSVMNHEGERGEVEVLGTWFNINAYPEEATINTTLVEGKVQLRSADKTQAPAVLHPGQEAQLAKDGRVRVALADVEQAIAWKKGYFRFRNMTIDSIMRMVSKWYGVQVVYEGTVTETFNGGLPRTLPISELLKQLASNGDVHFSVEGNTIRVRSH